MRFEICYFLFADTPVDEKCFSNEYIEEHEAKYHAQEISYMIRNCRINFFTSNF
jgi:hypothetical protein